MPKCNLIKNNIDEDLYISKLSNFFFNYKIGFEIKIITSEDEKKIFNQYFIKTNKKIKNENINKDNIFYYIDKNNILKKLNSEDIKYIDKEKNIIYYLSGNHSYDKLIILIKVNNVKNVYKIIHTIFLKCKNENDIENENIKYLFKKNDFEINIFNKDSFIIKFNEYIYCFNRFYFFILNKTFEIIKLINYSPNYKIAYTKSERYYDINYYIINNYLLILLKEPNNLIIFDLKNNQIISIINGLSGDLILELKNSKNILIIDEEKIIVFNYMTYSLINVHFFDEITYSENLTNKESKNITYDNYIYYSIIYKKNRLGKVNCL
jgi:hypothetical protein